MYVLPPLVIFNCVVSVHSCVLGVGNCYRRQRWFILGSRDLKTALELSGGLSLFVTELVECVWGARDDLPELVPLLLTLLSLE